MTIRATLRPLNPDGTGTPVTITPAQRLYLASTSPYRRALLERLGLPFECLAPQIEETPWPGESPQALVRRLSCAKAEAVALRLEAGLVIGSDQIAVLDGCIVGKPGNHARAHAQLAAASGKEVVFLTGICVRDAGKGTTYEHMDRTVVRFRHLTTEEIERYLAVERPYDCAGAFKSEGLGIALFESIETRDPTALVGLPLIGLCQLLRRAGLVLP